MSGHKKDDGALRAHKDTSDVTEKQGTKFGGDAVIEGDCVVIRFPFDSFQSALDGACAMNVIEERQKVTDSTEFAKEFCYELNSEDEQGTTLVHRMADQAFVNMIEAGAFGFDVHDEQEIVSLSDGDDV